MQQTIQGFSIAAAQLIEAACLARDGDCESAQEHIAHAMMLLGGQHVAVPQRATPIGPVPPLLRRSALAAWQVKRLAAHIDAHLGARISIDDLAALMNFSKSHFCRAFKATVGMTAHTWVMLRRIELAKAMLLTTNATLSEIALNCGMSDQSHFTRTFRRLAGATPYCWRRSRRDAMDERETRPALSESLSLRPPPSPAVTFTTGWSADRG